MIAGLRRLHRRVWILWVVLVAVASLAIILGRPADVLWRNAADQESGLHECEHSGIHCRLP